MTSRTLALAETTLRMVLFAFLIWLPLPFASVTDFAQFPLIFIPLYLFAGAAVVRLAEKSEVALPLSYVLWSCFGLLLLLVVAIQLVPLPAEVVRSLSPAASDIWSGAERVHDLLPGREPFSDRHPLSVAPERTKLHLLRLMAYFAAFQTAFLLVRRHQHRLQLALALCASALFQLFYGLQQLYRGALTIWGWENTKIFSRITGTYVNPNHYAHYLAIIFPIALYVAMNALGGRRRELGRFLERGLLPVTLSVLAALGCLAGILVAQSRGALFALSASLAAAAIVLTLARSSLPRSLSPSLPRSLSLSLGAGLLLLVAVVGLVRYFGYQQTIARFEPLPEERATLVGRTVGFRAAYEIWRLFPPFGSGLGSFEDVVLMRQSGATDRKFVHAHNDYLEIAATAGVLGFVCVVGLLAGYAMLWRHILSSGERARITRERRLFILAVLVSLTTVALHALIDFNFFIPANAATVAVLAGAVAGGPRESHEHDRSHRADS